MSETKKETQTPAAVTADISFEVGFGKDKTRFDLNMISVESENESAQRLNDISDSDLDKAEKQYQVMLDELVRFSQNPEDGEKLRDKFKTRDNKNIRIVTRAYWQYRSALLPDVNFL